VTPSIKYRVMWYAVRVPDRVHGRMEMQRGSGEWTTVGVIGCERGLWVSLAGQFMHCGFEIVNVPPPAPEGAAA